MNAVTKRTVTTVDTGETVHDVPVLVDYHMNDGYDWMDVISEHGWAVIPSWGCDGWDLGQWPYVMVAAIRTALNYFLGREIKEERAELARVRDGDDVDPADRPSAGPLR